LYSTFNEKPIKSKDG